MDTGHLVTKSRYLYVMKSPIGQNMGWNVEPVRYPSVGLGLMCVVWDTTYHFSSSTGCHPRSTESPVRCR